MSNSPSTPEPIPDDALGQPSNEAFEPVAEGQTQGIWHPDLDSVPQHSWLHRPVVGFDTETTGVSTTRDRIVTAALVSGPANDRFIQNWLIDPGIAIPAGASRIHGITTAHAQEHGQPAAEGIRDIGQALLAKVREGGIIVAFNAGYDLHILLAELDRYDMSELARELREEIQLVIDPLVLDRALVPYRKGKRTLTDLCHHYSISVGDNLHSADIDVLATLDLLTAMVAEHPQLADFEASELWLWQQQAHKTWAESFNQWRASKGLRGPGASPHWPWHPGQ